MTAPEISSKLPTPPRKAVMRFLDIFSLLAVVLGSLAGVFIVLFDKPLYMLLGVAGIIVFMVSLYFIEFGLVVLIFITYTRLSDVVIAYHGLPSFTKPFLAILIVSIFLRWALFHERPEGWFRPALLFGLLGLAGFASLIYSPVPDRVYARLVDDAKDVLIALVVVVLLRDDRAFRRTLWTLIWVAVFLGSLSVFQYASGTFYRVYGGFAISLQHQIVGEVDNFRATGPIGDPNFFAQIMVVLSIISFERFLHEKDSRLRVVALWGAAVSILTVLLTYSRGGLVAMAAGFLVLFIAYPPKRSQVPFIIFAGIAFFFLLPPNYLDRLLTLGSIFETRTTSILEERSLRGRLSENMAALEMVRENPLFGVGLSSYNYLFPAYSKRLGLALVSGEREAHNMYLEVTAETGIIGFSIFFLLLSSVFQVVFYARRKFQASGQIDQAGMATGYMAALVGYFVAAAFIHNAFPRYFYLLLGIAFSLSYVMDSKPGARSLDRLK